MLDLLGMHYSSRLQPFPALLQTSTVQASNGTTRVIMSLIKRKDVKNYFAIRGRDARLALRLVRKPEKQSPPTTDAATEEKTQEFAKDFSSEHCSPGGTVTAVVSLTPEDMPAPKTPSAPRI